MKFTIDSINWKFFYSLLIMLIGHYPQYRKHPKMGIDNKYRLPHYYGHLFRVCGLVMEFAGSSEAICLALLHDILEDTKIPKWLLKPLGQSIITKIELLTQSPKLAKPLRKLSYCNRLVLNGNYDTYLVSICDKWDNWLSYKMEGNIPHNVIEYYMYFTNTMKTVCSHTLLISLEEEINKQRLLNK